MMRNIYLHDRKGENSTSLCEVSLNDSFCQFVLKDNGFNSGNSALDDRL